MEPQCELFGIHNSFFFFNLMHIDFILDSAALKKVGYHHHPQKRQQGQVERWEDRLLVPEASRAWTWYPDSKSMILPTALYHAQKMDTKRGLSHCKERKTAPNLIYEKCIKQDSRIKSKLTLEQIFKLKSG